MKNFCRYAIVVVICALSISAVAQNPPRVGIINLKRVFDNYWKTKQGKGVLDQAREEADKQYKELIESWKKAKEDYQKMLESTNDQTVSSEEREKRKKASETKFREVKETEQTIQQYERQAASKLEDQRRRMWENIIEEIRNVVNAKAKSAGYTLVIDTAAESIYGTSIVIYNNGENDLTETVLSQLNAGAPLESSKTSATPTGPTRK